ANLDASAADVAPASDAPPEAVLEGGGPSEGASAGKPPTGTRIVAAANVRVPSIAQSNRGRFLSMITADGYVPYLDATDGEMKGAALALASPPVVVAPSDATAAAAASGGTLLLRPTVDSNGVGPLYTFPSAGGTSLLWPSALSHTPSTPQAEAVA